jgi:hypothetical protein
VLIFGTERHTQSPTLIVPQLPLCSTNRGIEVDRKMSCGCDAYVTGVTTNLEQSTYRMSVEQYRTTIIPLSYHCKPEVPDETAHAYLGMNNPSMHHPAAHQHLRSLFILTDTPGYVLNLRKLFARLTSSYSNSRPAISMQTGFALPVRIAPRSYACLLVSGCIDTRLAFCLVCLSAPNMQNENPA